MLASQVAVDVYLEKDLSYLEEKPLIEKSNIFFMSDVTKKTFCSELKKYIKEKKDLLSKLEEPQERNTRTDIFSIHDAKSVCDTYTNDLWKFIKIRIQKTDFSDNPCAFTEAPAEGIFSIYDRIITGRESLNLGNAVL